jgi:membrane fusion protein, multidrug efflux system
MRNKGNSMDVNQTTSQASAMHKPGRRKSIVGIIAALLGLAALGGLAWYLTHQPATGGAGRGGPGMGGRRGAPATTVGVATAEQADIPVIVEALGTVTARATATVRPQVSGVLTEVRYKEGQMVTAGQILAVIDPRPFEISLMQATGQLKRDEAQLENAKLTLQRYRTLQEQDSIAGQDVDTQAALVKQLEGTVTADRAMERTARLNLDYCHVTAPISGRIGLRVVDVGNMVSPNDAGGIAVITQTNPIDVQFSVPQDRIGELRTRINDGDSLPVTALDRTRETTLDTGRFLAMDNQVDVQTGTVRAKASFANTQNNLFPSQFVNARLLLRTVKGAIVVPVNALRHSSNGDYVYVLDSMTRTVALRKVVRGVGMVDKVQIASGLATGEQVITEGADRLKDGATVVLPGDKPMGGGRRQGGHGYPGKGDGAGASDGGAAAEASASAPKEGGPQRGSGERRRRREAAATTEAAAQ